MQDFLSQNPEELSFTLASWGQPRYRLSQLNTWVWQRGLSDYQLMTDLPAELRERLAAELPLQRAVTLKRLQAADGTRKYLLRFADGVAVETVGIPDTGRAGWRTGSRDGSEAGSSDGAAVPERLTVCVSSQAGCALGCVFCATGRQGLTRSLSAGEIAEQVRVVAADFGRAATNVVVMGQGEPFSNYDATLGALRLLNSADAFNIGARHITVSTSGIIAGIRRLAEEPEQFRLAVSLHGATQELRDRLMPGLRTQPLAELQPALAEYRRRSGRRVSLEYVLLRGINDRPEDIEALAGFARAIQAHINLLPYNDTGDDQLRREDAADARRIAEQLRSAGIETSIRRSRGSEIAAACGQLTS